MEIINATDFCGVTLGKTAGFSEALHVIGQYHVQILDKDNNILYEDDFPNTVVSVGKNHLLDNYLAGSAYTVTGPFMGLISSDSFTAISSADTMSSHGGWTEANDGTHTPTYTGSRQTAVFGSASAGTKALSVALSFAITGSGTLKGVFVVLGAGAVATTGNTAGTLFSAGLFSGGDQAVVSTNTVNISYSVSV